MVFKEGENTMLKTRNIRSREVIQQIRDAESKVLRQEIIFLAQ